MGSRFVSIYARMEFDFELKALSYLHRKLVDNRVSIERDYGSRRGHCSMRAGSK